MKFFLHLLKSTQKVVLVLHDRVVVLFSVRGVLQFAAQFFRAFFKFQGNFLQTTDS